MTAFSIFLIFVILQRVAELLLARRNEKFLKTQGAIEFDKNGYKAIAVMHVAFFISLISEKVFLHRTLNTYWFVFAVLFAGAQVLRYWAIKSLGVYWNTKILVLPNHSCYLTAFVFSLINLILLRRRIKIEESAIRKASIGFVTLL